jgi:hypothetical protein
VGPVEPYGGHHVVDFVLDRIGGIGLGHVCSCWWGEMRQLDDIWLMEYGQYVTDWTVG